MSVPGGLGPAMPAQRNRRMDVSRRAVGWLVVSSLAAACATEPAPAWHQEDGYRWRPLVTARGEPGFSPLPPATTGIRFENTVSDSLLIGNRILAQGAGVALGDVDGDGRPDIYLARTEGPNVLYRNAGGWRFEDVTATAGLAAADRYSTGAALADTDGDGDLDLILVSTTGPNALFVNDGAGRFTERRADAGLLQVGRGATTPALADVDGDGDLDLYVANYKPYSPADSIPPQQLAFNQVVRQVGPARFEVIPERRRDFTVIMSPDGRGGFLSMRADPDDFYLNEGGRFVRVPLTDDRFADASGRPLATEPESFGLGARFADLNGDRAPDLYVVNDFEGADEFWLNDGSGRFRLAPWTALRQASSSGMGIDVADLDGDGTPDLFEVDMLSNETRRLRTQMPTHTALPKRPGDLESRPQMQRNTLFLNRGDGTFGEIAEYAGVGASGWSWSTLLLDVDLDGRRDILIGAGHPWDLMDADTQERLQNRLTGVPWQRTRWQYPPLPLPNVAFRNRGDSTFEDTSRRWRFAGEPGLSHGMAAADLDDDGDLDLVINRLRAPALVLRNDAGAPRLAVRLVGAAPNTRAVGSVIRVLGGAIPLQRHDVTAGGIYLSHSDYLASFATGSADSVVVEVDWRDGRRSRIAGARPGRLYEISAPASAPPGVDSAPAPVPPLFEDATGRLGGHVHVENEYDDWSRQFLLPNGLSQLGPGVAWFDADRDGDPDLVIGAARGGRPTLFRNDGGVLRAMPGPAVSADLTTVLGLPTTAGATLLAGLSNWEAAAPEDVMVPPQGLRWPARSAGLGPPTPLLPPSPWAVGPLALADIDGDDDLDLFVGGRVVPGRYPSAPSSRLFRNDGGTYVADSAAAPDLTGVGMVSGAVFADLDGDGDPDLVLAREWGSLLVLLNSAGRFAPAPDGWGLARWLGRWHGVATGDFDGDGRLDLIATGWGRNLAARADSVRPMTIHFGRFGARGEIEMLLARPDPRLGGPAPLTSYARARVAVPDLVNRIRTFGAWADATVDQALAGLPGVDRLTVTTQDQMLFLNRGGRFEAVPMPNESQLAPAWHAGVADYDGDGFEDVFLSQNFHPTELGAPRLDTGQGLLLLGDGEGRLWPMSAARSGLAIWGDQRGAAHADLDGDGRLDLVVSQNGAATRLFLNRGARPGLRVRLIGPPGNPDGIGAQLRVDYGDRLGPVREVQAGSGYWSQNEAVQVLGLAGRPTAVRVRWPHGGEVSVPVPAGAAELVIRR